MVPALRTIILSAAMVSVMLLASVVQAAQTAKETDEFDDPRFNDDWEQKAVDVNEGQLNILPLQADAKEHHHHSLLTITEEDLDSGWLNMYQCHSHIDATSALQIVFRKSKVRDLRIVSQNNIEKAWVEGNTVQLENISKGSKICINLKTRALKIEGKKAVLKNGPFMRRFLDGYYPMRVSMQIEYPANRLRFTGMKPEGVNHKLDSEQGGVAMDVRFEGKLTTEIFFELED